MSTLFETWQNSDVISIRSDFAIDEEGYVYRRGYLISFDRTDIIDESWSLVGSHTRIFLDGDENLLLEDLSTDLALYLGDIEPEDAEYNGAGWRTYFGPEDKLAEIEAWKLEHKNGAN